MFCGCESLGLVEVTATYHLVQVDWLETALAYTLISSTKQAVAQGGHRGRTTPPPSTLKGHFSANC